MNVSQRFSRTRWPNSGHRDLPRGGFTLLELLLAISLSVLLLAGVYSGLNIYWRMSTTGQEEIERAQIARAVLRQIEIDLRSVVFKVETEGGGSSGSGGTSGGATGGSTGNASSGATTANTSIGTTPTTPTGTSSGGATNTASGGQTGTGGTGATSAPGVASEPAGLYGTSDTLRFSTCAPSRKNQYVPFGSQVSGVSRASDLLTVGYQLGDSITGMNASPVGLGRMEIDRLLLEQAEKTGNSQTAASSLKILAPEVTSLSFAYFDGYSWRSDWDSSTLGGLPMAVEVQIDVTTPARASLPGSPASKRPDGTQSFRLVVAMPMSKANDTLSAP